MGPDINGHSRWQLAESDYLKLVPILALAFYMAFIPHSGYLYPVHIDEWAHLAFSQELMRAGSTTALVEPFAGGSELAPVQTLEVGFHILWGVFQQLSGISWTDIFRYFPGIVFMMTVLSAYILGRRAGFGWEAALFACLIPTTIGIMGPAFLVPVALGLLFIPLSLFLAFNIKTWWSYLVLFIFTCFLLSLHAVTAVGLVIILVPCILLNLKVNFKHSLGITLALAIPFLAPFPWIFDMLLPTFQSMLTPTPLPTHVDFPRVIQTYGYIPILVCLLGTFVLALRGRRKDYSLILGLLAMLLVLVAFYTFHFGVSVLYERGLMYMMLMMSIIAGIGLMAVKKLKPAALGYTLCLILIGVTLAIAIPARQNISYYHMIDRQDYEAFVWIQGNVDKGYEKAILDPWKATAFTAITGKKVYTRIHAYPLPKDEEAREFLRSGSTDTAFLRENGISIIYTKAEHNNPDLVEVEKNIYLLKEAGTE